MVCGIELANVSLFSIPIRKEDPKQFVFMLDGKYSFTALPKGDVKSSAFCHDLV